ncbi:phosphotransferase family protein [Halobacterium rubrum]|uniref:phosphotransferase family protein n=1 Tax=Halobacterium TaxID=2239 RepID=UPI001F328B0B|nr:phosphotransferase [Halobacterium rubrum]MDH5019845.1 phosphotransferase [Halobacterium rubrum]
MTDALHSAASAAFPDRTIERVAEQDTRPGNETALVTLADGGHAYLKTATDRTYRLVREIAATQYAAEHCSVAVPAVLAADADGDRPYLATAPLDGTAMTDVWQDEDVDREWLAREAGRALAGVHEARFDAPAQVVGGDAEGLELEAGSWTDVLVWTVEERADDWWAERFSDVPGQVVDVLEDARPLLDGAPAALLHLDAARPNVHVDPPGLLDWERAVVGDPALDVVDSVANNFDQPDVPDDEFDRLRDAQFAGYRERAGGLPDGLAERRPVYRLFTSLLAPQAFEDWSADVDVSSDELAANVRAELDERIGAVRDAL